MRVATHYASAIGRRVAEKLNKEIERGNEIGAFTFALLFIAIPKDMLDGFYTTAVGFLQAIPGIGQMLAVGGAPAKFIVGAVLSATLYFFMLRKGWFIRWKIRIWYFILGFFVDNLPAADILPMSTFMLLYAWKNVHVRAARARKKLLELAKISKEEIENLDKDINSLDDDLTRR